MKKKEKAFDNIFLAIVLTLLGIGLLMVFSASAEYARTYFGNAYHFSLRQFGWAIIGIIGMLIFSKIPMDVWKKHAGHIMVLAVLLLIAVLFADPIKGSRRWIFGFQPSELAKFAVIIFLAKSLSERSEKLKKFAEGLLPYLFILGFIAFLIMKQPHMSATMVIVGTGLIMVFVAGARISHFLAIGIPALAAAVYMILSSEYRLKRAITFFNPFQDKLGDGWQIIQSLYAIGSGGIFGLGLGQSRQKGLYIPEPQNDFIFSILCEELGLMGAVIVIALFALLLIRGFKIALEAQDMFSNLVAVGITSLLAIEIIINIAVVTSSMPVTGMPLPFFSYGGTALAIHLSMMGVMLSISRKRGKKGKKAIQK